MGRWGEEEKKSKGLFGCTVMLLILSGTAWFFYHNYNRLENRRKIEQATDQIVTTGHMKSAEEMTGEILKFAEENDIELSEADIEMTKTKDGHGNWKVKTKVKFPMEVDFYFTVVQLEIPVVHEVVQIKF